MIEIEHPKLLINDIEPYYETPLGAAYLGNSLDLLKKIPSESIDLILTSPPFALTRQKPYGQSTDWIKTEDYINWFMPFIYEFKRILKYDGSIVLHIGSSWKRGKPIKDPYNYRLFLKIIDEVGLFLAQDFYWYNPAKLPSPAEWVTRRKIRVKDAVDPVWWFVKNDEGTTKANNLRVLKPYSISMKRLLKKKRYNSGPRPSGHVISKTGFLKDNNGAIPPNFISVAGTESNTPYLHGCKKLNIPINPARFPLNLPIFFIEFLTNEGDIILDPFAGSNTTGEAAEMTNRRWISIEIYEPYLLGSQFRFKKLITSKPIT